MFTPEQLEALQSAPKLGQILLLLCISPSFPVFSAFVSPFYAGKRCSSPNRRERLNGRQNVYLSIVGRSRRLTVAQSEQLLVKKFSYEVFANYLKMWSERWYAMEIEDIISLVALIDRKLQFFIDFSVISSFCNELDNHLAQNRNSPERAIHAMILQLLDESHSAAGSESLEHSVKSLLQRFIHHLHKQNIPILTIFVSHLRRQGNIMDGLPLISVLQGIYAKLALRQPELTQTLLAPLPTDNNSSQDLDESVVVVVDDKNGFSLLMETPQQLQQPRQREERREQEVLNSSVVSTQSARQLRQKLESFEEASRKLAQQLKASDEEIQDSVQLWQQLAGMEKQIAEARQLLASPEQQQLLLHQPQPMATAAATAVAGTDDNSVLTLVGLSTIEGDTGNDNDDREHAPNSVDRSSFTPSSFSVASTMTAASHNFNHNSSQGRFFFNGASSGRDKQQRFFEAASLSLALSNDEDDSSKNKGKNKLLVSPQRMLRFPVRHSAPSSPLATTGGNSKANNNSNYSTEARREKERALQLKHGLSSQVPLIRPKKTVNLQIIKSPIIRQVHGNRNVYDQARFAWVPSKGVSGDPFMKNKPIREERFQTVEDLKLGRQMFGVAYY